VHEPLIGIIPFVKVTDEVVEVADPPQVVLGLPETTNPLGNVSVSGSLIVAAGPALLKVIVTVELPPAMIVDGVNVLPSVTPVGEDTVSVAMAGPALLPLLVCNAPAASELI